MVGHGQEGDADEGDGSGDGVRGWGADERVAGVPGLRDLAQDVLQVRGSAVGSRGWAGSRSGLAAAHVPGAVAGDVEDAVVAKRKELADDGHDHGATTIQLASGSGSAVQGSGAVGGDGASDPGAPRVRVAPTGEAAEVVVATFEAPAPNEWWQIDAMDWVIAADGLVKVFNIVDDHSRVACRCRAVLEATRAEAWTTFCEAAERWGLPAGVLSDNGLCFSGKLRGFEVLFEAKPA